ncbi:hypothetical protein [Pseudomonas sp. xss_2]|uniref:hypothetical protein n=1 Tax=Pseudomonas sp. xss_2 TaxID=3367215 RepID=UPI00370B6716
MKKTTIPQQLAGWLERVPDMLGWDIMVAWPMELVQYLVDQDHLRRLANGLALKGLGARVTDTDTQITHQLANYRVSSPTLTLLKASYQRATFKLTMAMEEGTQLEYAISGEIASIRTNNAVNMLHPELQLDILYEDGKLCMDTASANKYAMDLGSGFLGRQGPLLISTMLKNAEPSKATLDLARVVPSASSELRMLSEIVPRSQAIGGQQALLLFMTHRHGARGFDPDDNGDKAFPPMLVPQAHADFSSTVVLSRQLQQRTAYGLGILGALEGAEFSYERAEGKPLSAMVAKAGILRIPAGRVSHGTLEIESVVCEVPVQPETEGLRITFQADKVVQTWAPVVTLDYRYRTAGMGGWTAATIRFKPDLWFTYKIDPNRSEAGTLEVRSFASSVLASSLSSTLAAEHAPLAAYAIRRGFINTLFKHLDARLSAPLLASLTLEGQTRLRPEVSTSIQGNLAMVGTYQFSELTPRIKEQNIRLAAGERQQFSLSQTRSGIEWACEPLPEHPWAPGDIDQNGLYTAPGMQGYEGATHRVRIVATDRQAQRSYTAQVTVVTTRVSVSPEIFIRFPTDKRAFEYESFKMDTDSVTWELQNVEGGLAGTMTPTGDKATYTPTLASPDAYCSVDRLVARLPSGKAEASGVMFSLFKDQTLFLYWDEANSNDTQLQLLGKPPGWDEPYNQITWWLPLEGPGRIERETGLYHIDPAAPGAFVLIRAEAAFGEETLVGHLLLLLPFNAFADVNKAQFELQQRKWLACSKRLTDAGK